MHIFRWLLLTLTSVMLSFGFIFYALAAPATESVEPLLISISIAQTKATVGKAMSWRVSLIPQGEQPITSVELRSGDTESWMWPGKIQNTPEITNATVLDIAAIPLVAGNLTPVIEAHIKAGNGAYQQLALAQEPVAVQSVEAQVEAKIFTTQGTVKHGGPLPLELWLNNSSPFTLTRVNAVGSGIDLAWDRDRPWPEIPPGLTNIRSLTPTVTGAHPQPQLTIFYSWTDDSGASRARSVHLTGEIVALEEGLIDKISDQSIGLLLGVAAGVLTTLSTTLAVSGFARWRQKKSNREQVRGLLYLLIEKSEQAADNGVNIELESFETIYKQEGLSTILKEEDLSAAAHNLWKMARRYNLGLNQPGGAQRTDELRRAIQWLRDKLVQQPD